MKFKGITYCVGLLVIFHLVSCNSDKTKYASSDFFEIAPPKITLDSALFRKASKVSFMLDLPGSQIRYTTNGDSVTNTSKLYDEPLTLTESTKINARVFHPDYLVSPQSSIEVNQIKNNISDAIVVVNPEPHSNYKAAGAKSITDMQKGTLQYRSGEKWLGFQEDTVTITINFKRKINISKVIVSNLLDQNGWIFSPQKITVSNNNVDIGSYQFHSVNQKLPSRIQFVEIPIVQETYSSLKITINALNKIPDWHQGKGSLPWLFIDEILIE